jgi:hypothetical protein
MVPRGTTLLAGGTAKATDTRFSLEANASDATCGILANHYLTSKARTTKYPCVVTVDTHAHSFSYDSCTTYVHSVGGEISHTDRNTLRRISGTP